MLDNQLRHSRFTSSENYKLLTTSKDKSFGKPALTYIEEKAMEVRLGRTLTSESNARPLQWGKCCEAVAFSKLDITYTLQSDETIVHPDYDYWSGTPDLIKHISDSRKKSGDVKCPQTLKSFCKLVDSFQKDGIQGVRDNHDDGEKYYWQIVSNAVLLEKKYGIEIFEGELVVYCPYQKDLDLVKKEAETWGFHWIVFGADCELPYLLDNGYYKDINVLAFDIPQSDKDLLQTKVIEAKMILDSSCHSLPEFSTYLATHDHEVNTTLIQQA